MKNTILVRLFASLISVVMLASPGTAQQCTLNGGEPLQPVGNKIEFRSGLGSAAKIGFSEFSNVSTPAKKYLKKAISGDMMRGTWPQAGCPDYAYPTTFSSSGSENRSGYPNGPFTWSGSSLTPIADNVSTVTYTASPGTGTYDGNNLQLRLSLDDGHIPFYTPNNLGGGTTFDLPKGTTYSVWVWMFSGNTPSGTLGSIGHITVGALPQTRDHWDIVQEYTTTTPSGLPLTTDTNASKRFSGFSDFPMSGGGTEVTPPAGLFSINGPAYGGTGVQVTPSQTTRTSAGTNQCTAITGGSEKYSGTVTETLTQEDTEQNVRTRAKNLSDNQFSSASYSTTPVAAYETSLSGSLSIEIQRVDIRAQFKIDCPGSYDLYINYAEKPHGSAGPVTARTVIERLENLESGNQTVEGTLKVEKKDTDYTVQSIELRAPCSLKPPGEPNFRVKSIHVGLSLGQGVANNSAGELLLDAENLSTALYTPAALVPAAPVGTAVIVRDGSLALRQVKVAQALADIVTLSATAYEVRFYSLALVGSQDPATGVYTVSGTPYCVFKFENPDVGQTIRLRITETRGSVVRVNEYSYNSGISTWTLSRGNGLRQETQVASVVGGDHVKIITVGDGTTPVSKTARTYRTYAWGEELISEVLDPDGAALATTYEFYSDAINDGGAYAHLKQRVNADGSWERYTYDSSGRTLKTIRPFLGAIVTDAENLCRVTENVYSTLADADGDGLVENLTTTINSVLGQETGRTYRVDWSKAVTLGADACKRRSDIRCVVAGAAWNAAGNLVTESLRYTAAPFTDRVRRVLNPDGTAILTAYAIDSGGQQTTTTKAGQPNGAFDDILDGRRTVTFTSPQGQTVGEAVTDIASTMALNSWTATLFDALGRPARIDFTDGTYVTRDYACCGLNSERDRTGLVTSYTYDDLGRQKDVMRNGITSRTVFDADGRVKTITRIGTDSSPMVQETNQYDLAGRLYEHRDALNRLTSTSEVFSSGTGQTTLTVTDPGAGTRIEIRARDGSRLSVGGTATAPLTYDYGIESNENYVKETRIGQAGATTEWSKTYTDFAGRSYKIVYADNATTQSYFNAAGQLVRQVDPDGIITLFAYNARGEQEVTAIDMDADGVIDYTGTDRITKTVGTVTTNGTYTVQRSTTTVWEADNADTPVTISIADQSVDGLRTWQTVRGQPTTSVSVLDGSGGRTVTTTGPDGVKTIQVYAGDRLASTTVKTAADVQLAAVTNVYDTHGRLWTSADARNGTTTYAYFNDDQIQSVTTPDPDPTRSGPGYDPQTTTYHYDSAGRPDMVTQPDGTVVNTTYWPTGAVKRIWGSRTYPVEYTYDPQGRVKTLTTWKDFAGNSGTAVTTWNYHAQRGWLENKRYADNTGPGYTYKPSGRLYTRVWARTPAITTTYSYNTAGDLQGIDYSDATPDVTMFYERAGRPKTITDASGSRTLGYHVSGQLKDEDYTAGLLNGFGVHRTFDSLARLDSITALSGASTLVQAGYGYNSASRLDTVASGANSATYGYVANSALVESVTFKQGGVTRLATVKDYDNLNRLKSITNTPALATAISVAYTYNSANQRTKAVRETNAYWNYGYDSLGQVTSGKKFTATDVAVPGHDFAWTFDDIGNRKMAVANGGTSTYSATNLNQYSSRTVPGLIDVMGEAQANATVTTTYPATGGTIAPTTRQGTLFYKQLAANNSTAAQNPSLKVTGVKNLVGANGEDAVTEITKTAYVAQTPEGFTHDTDGNLTDDARWHYTWDGENRLFAMETSAAALAAGVTKQKLEFAYDGQGRRFSKKVYNWSGGAWALGGSTLFLYDGWNMVAELNALSSNAVIRTHVWGTDLFGSMLEAGGVGGLLFTNTPALGSPLYAACFDGNGNVIAYVDLATGAKSATYEYGAFGETLIADGPNAEAMPFRFSTKYRDSETGLVYYGERYKGDHGWLNRDPLEESGGVNIYGFVLNDPINFFDTDGREVGSQNPGLAPEGRGSQWRDPGTGQFAKPPQLPPPPSSGKILDLPGSRDAGNSVKGYGSLIISVANQLPGAIFETMLKYGRSECQKQQARTGKGCACCVVRVYKITSISAFWGNQDSYIYGFARVVRGSCDQTSRDFEGPEIVPYYAPTDTALARAFNKQTTVTRFFPW